jgi:hypothetical protein
MNLHIFLLIIFLLKFLRLTQCAGRVMNVHVVKNETRDYTAITRSSTRSFTPICTISGLKADSSFRAQ